ncbi:hypothetical protein FBALC1_03642 [Flavobacteriales bacterium ALC-1]|nr:hypothetical protein FBALC1_03642 [Flavobacteriales bacterium ALC-1]
MIKFFRKIRYKLMETGKTGKYFKYAIGEIILVVIGILIALQINNWNENRINSNKETAILANIHKEFKQNQKQLDSVVFSHRRSHSNSAKIIKLFPITTKPKPAVLDSLSYQLFWSYGGVTFNPSQTSINALASTSSFDIIKNKTLRDLLISWNDLITDYQEEELRSRDYIINQYDAYMSKHFDWKYNFKDERNNFDALQTLEFEYLIKNNYDLVDQILNSSGELQKVQETLDNIIELSKPKNN